MSKDPWVALEPEFYPLAEDEPDEAAIDAVDDELFSAFGNRDAFIKYVGKDKEYDRLNVRQHGSF